MDITEARQLFATAEITPEGQRGTDQELDEWLDRGCDLAFYRAVDGRVLALPADPSQPPWTRVFSDRYDSAALIGVFPNPNPRLEEPSGEEPEDTLEDEDGEPDDDDFEPDDENDFDDLVDAFTVRWGDDEESRRHPVQTLNMRRARQFLLTALKASGTRYGEPAFHDLLLDRGHGLAFYAGTEYGRRELLCRHYGGPTPRLLPAVPPEILEGGWGEPWRLIATYQGPELFDESWNEQVSTLPLESFLTVHVSDSGECALRIRNEILELVRAGKDGTQTVTALGRLGSGDDPLALALQAVPDLLTFDPHTAVDITTDAPFAVADAIRFSADLNRHDGKDKLNEDFFTDEEDCLLSVLDSNLVPVMFRVNGVPHFAAQVEGDWVLVPVEARYRFPSPVTNRTFISVSFDYDGGGYSSGKGFEAIAEIRPGLNIAWEDYSDEAWDREMTLSRTPLPEFAASHHRQDQAAHHQALARRPGPPGLPRPWRRLRLRPAHHPQGGFRHGPRALHLGVPLDRDPPLLLRHLPCPDRLPQPPSGHPRRRQGTAGDQDQGLARGRRDGIRRHRPHPALPALNIRATQDPALHPNGQSTVERANR
jgi:hypothetical protein